MPPASSNVNILRSGLQPTPASCQVQVEPPERASPTPEEHPAEPLRDSSFRLGYRNLARVIQGVETTTAKTVFQGRCEGRNEASWQRVPRLQRVMGTTSPSSKVLAPAGAPEGLQNALQVVHGRG